MGLNQPKALVVSSGGLDSTTAIYDMLDQGMKVDTISFNYGQRHKKELEYAARTADRLGLEHHLVDLSGLTGILGRSGSSLVSDVAVPEGHYAEENMKKTVVPNRNMMMLAVAGSVAVATGCNFIVTGVHAGDHAVYPDCRPRFVDLLSDALVQGNEGFGDMRGILAPYVMISKAAIARRAILLGVPLNETWSCYKGKEDHCGRCGTCVERLEAISEAINILEQEGNPIIEGWYDPTTYTDEDFWIDATEEQIK